jgi:aldose 1-epimerase
MNSMRTVSKIGLGLLAMAASTTQVQAATAERANAGALGDGTPIEAVTLTAPNGVTARVLAYGATLQSLALPDRKGKLADVVLGHDTAAEYVAVQDFFGVTVGRFANRIARGTFVLDGKTYRLPLNNGENTLHGGGDGFDRRLWKVISVESGSSASVTMELVSPDGDMGYPGQLTARVTYALSDQGALTITMTAQTTKPTIVNLTNHALFNMAGHCAPQGAMGNLLTMSASRYTPVDASLIPTGELAPVAGTPFDFRTAKSLSSGLRDATNPQILIGRGFDHNWVLDKGLTAEPELIARVEDPDSGRTMEVLSTEPGLQMYTGNFIDGTNVGKGGCLYRMGDGYVLEPQKFPDTPNQPAFGSARLDPGQTYRHVMVLRPGKAK